MIYLFRISMKFQNSIECVWRRFFTRKNLGENIKFVVFETVVSKGEAVSAGKQGIGSGMGFESLGTDVMDTLARARLYYHRIAGPNRGGGTRLQCHLLIYGHLHG